MVFAGPGCFDTHVLPDVLQKRAEEICGKSVVLEEDRAGEGLVCPAEIICGSEKDASYLYLPEL